MDTQLKDGIQREARALLALGWVPAADEPGRLYPLFAVMPPVVVQRFVWEVMLDLVEDRRGAAGRTLPDHRCFSAEAPNQEATGRELKRPLTKR